MKIAIITPVFPYPNRGIFPGAERYVENLAIYLKKKGNDVKVITTFWNGGNKYDDYKGIPILRIQELKNLIGKKGSLFFLHYFSFGLNLFRKKNAKFYIDSDIIFLNMPIGFTRFLKTKRIPIISIFFHYVPITSASSYLFFPFYHLLERIQYKRSNIITISKSSKRDLVKYYGLKEKFISVIPIGIDIKKFNIANYSKKIRETYGNNILLYTGLMIPRKRIPILLKAMSYVIKEIPDAHLILTGDGLLLEPLKNLTYSLKIQENVTFLGFLNDNELLKYLTTSDIFVFPSELEGFGQVILEAIASGTPVICSNKPPMCELVKHGGITFRLNNSKDLSNKIIQMLKNREDLAVLREQGQTEIKKYDWENVAKIYNNYIKNIIKLKR